MRLVQASVALAALVAASPLAAQQVKPAWSGITEEMFQTYVVAEGLKALGYDVAEVAQAQIELAHVAVGNGDLTFYAAHWEPLRHAYWEESGGDENLQRVGRRLRRRDRRARARARRRQPEARDRQDRASRPRCAPGRGPDGARGAGARRAGAHHKEPRRDRADALDDPRRRGGDGPDVRGVRARAIVTAHDSAWETAFDLTEAGAKPAVIVDVRPTVDPALTDRARALGIETLIGRTVTGTTGRLRVKSLRVNRSRTAGRRARDDRLRRRADVRRLDALPASLLPHQGQARLGRELKAYLPGKKTEAVQIAGAGRGLWGIASRARRRRRGRRAGRHRRGPRRRPRRPTPSTPTAPGRASPQGAADRPRPGQGQGLRRLPERRHRQGHPPRGPRGNALDRARQALHHQRHGDRPGQDVERQRPDDRRRRARQGAAAGRADHLPPALYADDLRHLRRLPPGRDLRGHAADPDRPLGRGAGRGLRAGRALAPRPVLPEGGRGHARRGRPRVPRHPRLARHLRRLDPRQDRGRRGRTPSPSWSGCTPTPGRSSGSARCRYGLLLGEDGFIRDDGVIGRLAGRPLPRHDHHRRRRARAQHDGGLPADRVARPEGLADLDHRAVGDGRAQRPERPQAARALGRGPRHLGGGLPAHVGRGMHGRRLPGAAVPRLLHRRARLRGQRPRPPRPRPLGDADRGRASSTTSAPTAPRRCTCCAPRRATSSSARTPTAR